MAELIHSTKDKKYNHLHKSIKVDLTPMVDLGFLLITFFILTTTLQEQSVMKLTLPKDSTDSSEIPLSKTLTFILNRNDSISYYEGLPTEIRRAGFGEMRNIILQKQISLNKRNIDKKEMIIVIKPTLESNYKNFIDALDEIHISDCRHYFVAEPEKSELL